MSFRADVNRERIELFLRELGRSFRGVGRIYLVGGTTLVYERLRAATLDIDLAIDVPPEGHAPFMRELARLKDRLGINVEKASPRDFIPLPSGWQERSPYVGRFGQLDVFHFDLVSTALSKLARGYEEDVSDVRTLLTARLLSAVDLKAAWNEIVPQLPDRGWSRTEIDEYAATVQQVLADDTVSPSA